MRRVLSTAVAGALAIVSLSSQRLEPEPITFGLSPATSTIVFHPPAPLPNPSRPPQEPSFALWSGRAFAIGDFNGDGLNDIALTPTYLRYQPKMTIQFWLNQGNGVFADGTSEVLDGPAPEHGGATTYVADFNRDGRDDIFIGDSGLEDKLPTEGFDGGRHHVLLSQPNGKLKDTTATSLPDDPLATNHPSNMADINGDGAMDLVLQRLGGVGPGGQGTMLAYNDGHGRFTQTTHGLPREIAYMSRTESSATPDRHAAGTVGACDFDKDGRTDLVTASYTNTFYPRNVRMYAQGADGRFVERFRIALPPEIIRLAAERTPRNVGAAGITCTDLDRDSLPDVAVHWETDTAYTYIQFLRNAGNFRFEDVTLDWFGVWETSYPVRGGVLKSTAGLEFRDLNGDGTIDFYPKNQGSYEPQHLWSVRIAYLNDGTGHFQPMSYRPTSGSVTVTDLARAIGCLSFCSLRPLLFDATGDGLTDLVLLETWTLRSSDMPTREDRVLVHTLRGHHTRESPPAVLFGRP